MSESTVSTELKAARRGGRFAFQGTCGQHPTRIRIRTRTRVRTRMASKGLHAEPRHGRSQCGLATQRHAECRISDRRELNTPGSQSGTPAGYDRADAGRSSPVLTGIRSDTGTEAIKKILAGAGSRICGRAGALFWGSASCTNRSSFSCPSSLVTIFYSNRKVQITPPSIHRPKFCHGEDLRLRPQQYRREMVARPGHAHG